MYKSWLHFQREHIAFFNQKLEIISFFSLNTEKSINFSVNIDYMSRFDNIYFHLTPEK